MGDELEGEEEGTETETETEPVTKPVTKTSVKPPVPETKSEGFYKREADRLQKKLKEIERKGMSESEKAKAEANDWKAIAETRTEELEQIKIENQFGKFANEYGVDDFETVALYSKGKISLGEDGKLIGAESFLKELKKSKPHLFKNTNINPGGRGENLNGRNASKVSNNGDINSEIRRSAGY